MDLANPTYRGRLAPSPTGYLHLGHARTFWIAQQRTQAAGGVLVLRNEDLDAARVRAHVKTKSGAATAGLLSEAKLGEDAPEFVTAMLEDLRWFGFAWQEGPDCGGPFGPYNQSERGSHYLDAFQQLRDSGKVYFCRCSRKDILNSPRAPHASDEEPIYPGTCRPKPDSCVPESVFPDTSTTTGSWRFQVPDGETIRFIDGHFGPQQFIAGKDFGDFVVWRHDLPAYQLAVVVDDAAMRITEVVRGADLLLSTARQILLYRALGFVPPAFYHCPLMNDEKGVRLAKRHDSLSLRSLRLRGESPETLRHGFGELT